MSSPPDRAKVVTVTILAIVVEALKSSHGAPSDLCTVQKEVEAYLRDEFNNIAREVFAERSPPSEGISHDS